MCERNNGGEYESAKRLLKEMGVFCSGVLAIVHVHMALTTPEKGCIDYTCVVAFHLLVKTKCIKILTILCGMSAAA